jgi:hypothetical protein
MDATWGRGKMRTEVWDGKVDISAYVSFNL